jgi:PAS domain S-box-containing protein
MIQGRIRQFLIAPTFADENQTIVANIINMILLTIMVNTSIFMLALFLLPTDRTYQIVFIPTLISSISLKFLLNRGYFRTASILLVSLTWLIVTVGAINTTGIYAPINSAYIIVIILSSIVFDKRAPLYVAGLCSLTGLGLIYVMKTGFIPELDNPILPLEVAWLSYTFVYVIVAILFYFVIQIIERSTLTTHHISQELQQSTDYLKRAEALAHLGNFEFDIQTQSVKWSDETYRIFGIEIGTAITLETYQILMPEESFTYVMTNVQQTIETGKPYEVEHPIILTNGVRKDLYAVGDPILDDKRQVTKIFGIVQDITERKRAEQIRSVLLNISKARHETSNLQELLEYTFAQLGELISITSFYVALYDEKTGFYSLPFGVDEHDTDWSPSRLTDSLTDYVRRTGKAQMVTEEAHRLLEKTSGVKLIGAPSKIWLGAPLKIQQRVIGVIVIQDYENPDVYQQSDLDFLTYVGENIASVIDSKRAENERLELQTQKQNNDFLQEFVGHMTHDLKTPLSVIKNSTYLLQNVKEPSRQIEYIERINYQLDRLDRMVDDILTIAHLDHIQFPSQSKININDLLKHVTQQLHPKMQRKHLQLDLDLASIMPMIIGSEGDLTRALLNLLENATNYCEDKGKVVVRTYVKDDYVVCEIRDTGIGIKPDDLVHIFDRFYRADNARDFERGTGLGLAIVSRVIELHNGSIDVKSELGEGTIFTIKLTHTNMIQHSNPSF